MKPHDVILYPLMTERSIYMIENENKLVFVVNRKANKQDISNAMQALYGVEVDAVNTLISRKSTKKAFVKLKEGYDASDLAIRLGIL
ncbi:MAG: 50S ribosomal protein L23 [Candidatus Bathyarchaeota archaeon]|nr:MAG: 50S ribosomal protein L23 [Candidatus Bathyarchaeota archaeon]